MSKLDSAPFKIHDKVRWFYNRYSKKQTKHLINPKEFKGVITDAFYQKETKGSHPRREGWRLLIRKDYIDNDSHYIEKYFDEVKLT
jgi:hypothetical protein